MIFFKLAIKLSSERLYDKLHIISEVKGDNKQLAHSLHTYTPPFNLRASQLVLLFFFSLGEFPPDVDIFGFSK
jgi:hypothetical protein